MKFLTHIKHVSALELSECEILRIVEIYSTRVTNNAWGNGCIFESDEYYNTFCQIKFGFEPVMLSEDEYNQIISDGQTFIDKSRGTKIRKEVGLREDK